MTAKTHVLGSMSLALGGYILMDKGGLLIPDVEPLIQLGIILPYSVWASTVPDLDQAHDSVAQSSPINLLIQRFFKIVKAGHRSVKSHVAPAFISLATYLALAFNMIGRNLNGTEITILALAVLGITAGLVSHFLLDIMTRDGITIGKVNIRVVPDTALFGAGTDYERIVRRLLYVLTTVLFIYILFREVV